MILAEKAYHSVSMMCRALGVKRGSFYAWSKRDPSQRAAEEARLTEAIRQSHKASRGTYGSPRITTDLKEAGETIGHNRVAQLMRRNGIVGKPEPKWIATTDSQHDLPVAPNLVSREFGVDAPNRVWVGDITYSAPGSRLSQRDLSMTGIHLEKGDEPIMTTLRYGRVRAEAAVTCCTLAG